MLIMPPYLNPVKYIEGWSLKSNDYGSFPPLGLLYIGTWLTKHTDHEVKLLDAVSARLSHQAIRDEIAAFAPDIVGLTTFTVTLVDSLTISKNVKAISPDIHVCWGGPHVNAYPAEALAFDEVDSIVLGEGERVFTELVDALSEKRTVEGIRGIKGVYTKPLTGAIDHDAKDVIENLDDLPFPDRSWMPPGRYYTPGMRMANATTMMASRGCPYNCVFCSVPHRFRIRSVENVVEEMVECERKYGIQEIHFVDDLFNVTDKRLVEFCEQVIRRNVKIIWGFKGSPKAVSKESLKLAARAGCVRAHYGVETYTAEGLKALGKVSTIEEIKKAFALTRAAGIRSIAYMIIGSPHEKSFEEVTGCIPFIRDLRPDYVVYSLFSPYPESRAFQLGVERGLWDKDAWQKFMLDPRPDYDLPTAWTEYLSKEQLVKAFRKVNYAFYAHPATLWRTFTKIRTWAEFKRIIQGGLSLARLSFIRGKNQAV